MGHRGAVDATEQAARSGLVPLGSLFAIARNCSCRRIESAARQDLGRLFRDLLILAITYYQASCACFCSQVLMNPEIPVRE